MSTSPLHYRVYSLSLLLFLFIFLLGLYPTLLDSRVFFLFLSLSLWSRWKGRGRAHSSGGTKALGSGASMNGGKVQEVPKKDQNFFLFCFQGVFLASSHTCSEVTVMGLNK